MKVLMHFEVISDSIGTGGHSTLSSSVTSAGRSSVSVPTLSRPLSRYCLFAEGMLAGLSLWGRPIVSCVYVSLWASLLYSRGPLVT